MDFEFVIPLHREDLLTKSSVDQYVVDEVLPIRLIPAKIQECRSSYRSRGPLSVIDNFDSIFSLVQSFFDVSPDVREDAWELLVKALPVHANGLVEVLDTEMDMEPRKCHLNALKMNTYLLAQFIDIYEAEATKPSAVSAGKGKKKKAKSADMGSLDWEYEREVAIRALIQVMQLNIHRLWDPPVAEEEFVNVVTGVCYKLLENPDITRHKSTRDAIFQLLGIVVKKYNHALSCSLKIIQLLQHFEHLASPLASAVELFANEYGVKTVAAEIMREIGRMDAQDLVRDTSGTRAYGIFLVELSEKIPTVLLHSISVMLPLLDQEPYTMRNCVLGVLGHILVKVLCKQKLEEKEKNTRDKFLDRLEDHLHDVNAFVRSKTLQVWHVVVAANALPLARQKNLMDLVIGRLNDKSSSVRKYAIQCIQTLLDANPFAGKFSIEELRANYAKENEKLEALVPEETPEDKARKEAANEWNAIEPQLLKALQEREDEEEKEKNDEEEKEETDKDSTTTGSDVDKLIGEEESANSVKDRIQDFLKSSDFKNAIKLWRAATEAFVGNRLFSPAPKEREDGAESDEEEDKEESTKIFEGLKYMFLGEKMTQNIMNVLNSSIQSTSSEGQAASEHHKQHIIVQYLKSSIEFVNQLERAVPAICNLLSSKNVTDVLESIDFFVTAFEFGLSNAMQGIRRMLVLVWVKDQGIKDAVVNAYKRLYLKPAVGNERARALAIANNLTALTVCATMGDLASLDLLVTEFMKTGDIDQSVIQMLWERFAMKITGTTELESRASLQLLGMAAGAEMDIVKSNVDVLIKEGLGPRAEDDFLLARDSCLALLKLCAKKQRGADNAEPFRFPVDHEMFQRLSHLLIQGLTKEQNNHWIPLAEQAVNVIYKLAEHPDRICGHILKKLANVVMTYSQTETPVSSQEEPEETDEAPAEMEEGAKEDNENPEGDKMEDGGESQDNPDSQDLPDSQSSQGSSFSCPSKILTRMLAASGHVALRQLVLLDVDILGELKRRHHVQEKEKESEKGDQGPGKSKKDKKQAEQAEDLDDEMGLAGAAAEDAEIEYMRKITEMDIVTGSNLLALLQPLIVRVCANQTKYSDPELRAAASLALAKYMLVSSEFCENQLQLLCTLLEKSPNDVIRANTIIALGDLTFRFPNLVEPWTPNLYARLRDPAPLVRRNTLKVLTHLILNDMVKVKGQISEMATCIVDHDTRIAGLAKLFFHELANKGNAIYNIMPDMISRLSDPDVGVDEEHFRTIMRYLFSFIQKDRQCESLVEKLCHRFRATRSERQWRDLSFCLSLLSYSEKSIRKLQENLQCYSDKLHEDEVYNCFVVIISGAKKFAKQTAKAIIDEYEGLIEQCHNKGVEDEEVNVKANKAASAAKALREKNKRTPARGGRRHSGGTPSPRKATKTPRPQQSQDESDEDFLPSHRGKKGKPKVAFSDDESDVELFEMDKNKNNSATPLGPGLRENDENSDPNNIEVYASPSPIVKKRHKSVNNVKAKAQITPNVTRSRRAKTSSVR